jgi:hypothetical protein
VIAPDDDRQRLAREILDRESRQILGRSAAAVKLRARTTA